jgi:hypothetical protein
VGLGRAGEIEAMVSKNVEQHAAHNECLMVLFDAAPLRAMGG